MGIFLIGSFSHHYEKVHIVNVFTIFFLWAGIHYIYRTIRDRSKYCSRRLMIFLQKERFSKWELRLLYRLDIIFISTISLFDYRYLVGGGGGRGLFLYVNDRIRIFLLTVWFHDFVCFYNIADINCTLTGVFVIALCIVFSN